MDKYENKFNGKIAYVLGTGPSLDSFVPEPNDNTVFVGMNTCYMYPNIAKHLTLLISEYFYDNVRCPIYNITNKPRFVKKKLISLIKPNLPIFYDNRNPHEVKTLVNNRKFINKHPHNPVFLKNVIGYAPGITYYDGIASTAFLTVLFAAYTGVSEIRIIGCDCTGYAKRLLPGWVILKKILDTRYPDIKIIATGNLTDVFKHSTETEYHNA